MSQQVSAAADGLPTNLPTTLHTELRTLIASSRQRLAGAVNAELTRLYWAVGLRLATEVLGSERAQYGSQLLGHLGQQLSQEFGRGFEARNLRRMVKFAQAFPSAEIVSTLSTKLSWSHMVAIVALKAPEAQQFYARQAAQDGWSVRELAQQIDRKAFERSAIAHANAGAPVIPAVDALVPAQGQTVGTVFKDPYFLDFLGLRQGHDEADLEAAILRQLEAFILELGRGFAFVERQKRMVIDGEDFYLDLLFYHRRLRRLVAIELKLGRFKAAHKGQMELYLKWLDQHERQQGEEAPIGLILCAESSREQVELLQMHKDGITVAEYWTELPPKAELEQHLHQALLEARERLARRGVLLDGGEDE
ncbi:PDDEXK nuclease domain-containing protein [Acidovorax sp. SUPP2522]|uniref:PDDEXK nuclease domain-containing protein n=1 Tax=unclassified Acidovorax TaxID=2684926 RepID=UPI0023491706|nr:MULTISPECIES: PDDEXK nuclease domain-containing protein [unclassified Acidovorax]WCM98109.1 PDDEXK nuclease domain-containing protein [Acidovorax sp. GBBC 1281]GKT19229.1 PDDEXK nuclease domain-containing protein [Acidovorax sp. SUPP2522]